MLSQLSRSHREEASDDIHIDPPPVPVAWLIMPSLQALHNASALRLSLGVGDMVEAMAKFAAGMATGVKHAVPSLDMEEDRSSDNLLRDFRGESVTVKK